MAQNREPSPFLSLPLELRNSIYSYLLSTKYTRKDTIKQIKSYAGGAKGHHYRPAHSYSLHPAILRCNRQTNQEATAVFHNTNLFISISHNYSNQFFPDVGPVVLCDRLEKHCHKSGLPILAKDEEARAFNGMAMEIYVGRTKGIEARGTWWNDPKAEGWIARPRFMIACEDLLEFCKIFLFATGPSVSKYPDCNTMIHLEKTMLLVDVLHMADQHDYATENPRPAMRRLLEPLCYLHNIGLVIIQGPLPTAYIESITQRIQRPAPNVQDLIRSTTSLEEQANAAYHNGAFHSAISLYDSALENIYAGSQTHARSEVVLQGKLTGMPVGKVKAGLQSRLYRGLARANFQLQRCEMMHHCAIGVVVGGRDTNHLVAQLWYYKVVANKSFGASVTGRCEVVEGTAEIAG